MIAVSKVALKERMNEYFQKVEESGEELVVYQNEIPVLKIIPFKRGKTAKELFADVQGTIKYHGDILEPESEEWGELQ